MNARKTILRAEETIAELWNMFFILSFVILPHEKFDPSSNNPLTAIHYYHPSRTRHKCINCEKMFNLTRHDKCPHCGKSCPYYTREEWDRAQK